MAHIPFAFSVHHFVSSVGSYAGFASIIGLAILVLLYFAQARETATLRNRADEAEQRAGQLEARLAQASRVPAGRPAAAVAQRPLPAARPLVNPAGAGIAPPTPAAHPAGAMAASAGAPGAEASAPAAAAMPAAPAGVGAPALSAATRLIPAPVVAQQLAPAASSAPAAGAAAAASAAPVATASPPPATAAGAAALGAAGSNGPGAGTNGTSEEFAVALADPAPVAAPAPLELAPPEPAPEPLPRVQLRPGGAAQTRPAAPSLRRPSPPRSPSRVGRGLALVLTALGVVAVVVVLVIVTSGGGSKTASTGGTRTTNAPSARHRAKAKSFNTSAVTVAVLNGTATSGAAARLSAKLGGFGYKPGPTTNAANQTQTSTVVMYLAGHRNDAAAVARSLKLPSSSVQAIDSQTQAIACPSTTSCAVDVVVTVGQDLAG